MLPLRSLPFGTVPAPVSTRLDPTDKPQALMTFRRLARSPGHPGLYHNDKSAVRMSALTYASHRMRQLLIIITLRLENNTPAHRTAISAGTAIGDG